MYLEGTNIEMKIKSTARFILRFACDTNRTRRESVAVLNHFQVRDSYMFTCVPVYLSTSNMEIT
ncbi:MAG: hypothetical protein UZ14_CFX002002925 [Chloroflexi bacterium OLB14]|nr:MAG: hypothetical protein UZ14_CFX002002925 [Chloroflexi bacterium OLB14]